MDFKRFFAFLDDKSSIGPKLEKIARILFFIGFGISIISALFTLLSAFVYLSWRFDMFLLFVLAAAAEVALGYLLSYLGYISAMALARLVTNSERIAQATEKMAADKEEENI
ncbi:MAG: hypothetical protein IJ115_05835 [Erysipelotrichaceae bacterium]|nr:hypothetical protein [Erysipelotrichaceae bacterium]